MWNFEIGRTFRLMFSTLPFIALRTAVYFGCSLLLLLGYIGGPALGVRLMPNSMWEVGFWGGLIVGGGGMSMAVYALREYFLYLVKAGHIAVLVELMEGRSLPKGQFSYAKTVVAERFVEASSFFVIDQVVKSILGIVNKLLMGLGSFIPGMGGAMDFIGTVLRTSLSYADEVILALSFRTRSTDVWRTSRDGVVLYAQNYKVILKNAFVLAVINYALVFMLFILAWGPAAWIASMMPGSSSALLAFVITLLLVYSLKKAFIEPFLMTALMQVYFQCIEGQVPNPAWIEKLEKASDKFRSMSDKFTSPMAQPESTSAVQQANQYQQALPQAQQASQQAQYQQQAQQQAQYQQQAQQAQYQQQAQQAQYQQQAQQAQYQQQAQQAQQQAQCQQQAALANQYQQALPQAQQALPQAQQALPQAQQALPQAQQALATNTGQRVAPALEVAATVTSMPLPQAWQEAQYSVQALPNQPMGSTTLPLGLVNQKH